MAKKTTNDTKHTTFHLTHSWRTFFLCCCCLHTYDVDAKLSLCENRSERHILISFSSSPLQTDCCGVFSSLRLSCHGGEQAALNDMLEGGGGRDMRNVHGGVEWREKEKIIHLISLN